MYTGKTLFAQLMDFLPWTTFARIVERYGGDRYVKSLRCAEHFRVMAFAQLTYRESLRDIEACLRAQPTKLYHMGLRDKVRRSALADANESRDWRIYAEFAHSLIRTARRLYAQRASCVELAETVYALDATTIDLCLALFPWAKFRKTKAAVKLHTLLDLRGAIPSFIHISDGKLHDVNVLDVLIAEAGRLLRDGSRLPRLRAALRLHQAAGFFVTRAKSNFKFKRVYSRPVDRSTGLHLRPEVELVVFYRRRDYPAQLRRIGYRDAEGRQTGILDQSYDVGGFDHLRAVQLALASRTVLQVDQATPTHQALLSAPPRTP